MRSCLFHDVCPHASDPAEPEGRNEAVSLLRAYLQASSVFTDRAVPLRKRRDDAIHIKDSYDKPPVGGAETSSVPVRSFFRRNRLAFGPCCGHRSHSSLGFRKNGDRRTAVISVGCGSLVEH